MSKTTSSPRPISRSPGSACGRAPLGPAATIVGKEGSAPCSRIRASAARATSSSLRPARPRSSDQRQISSASSAAAAIAASSASSLTRRSFSTVPPAPSSSTPSGSFSSRRFSVRTAMWSSSKPILPLRRLGDPAQPVVGDGDHVPALDLGLGALGVAEVGEEDALLGAADAGAVGAAEAGQVADVDQVGDEQAVELALGDERREAIAAARHQLGAGAELAGEQLQRLAVAVGALAGDLGQDQAVEDRELAPVVARLDVGEVDLDRGQAGDVERVGDRAAVVGPGAGVDERPRRPARAAGAGTRRTRPRSWSGRRSPPGRARAPSVRSSSPARAARGRRRSRGRGARGCRS